MSKKFVVPLSVTLLLIAIIGALAGIKALQIMAMIQAGAEAGVPVTTVSAAEVTEGEWEATIPAVGSVTAFQGIMVSNEVAGTVSAIHFHAGAQVEAGDLLVELDTSVEEANRARALAQLELAKKTVTRSRELRSRNSIPQSELDAAEANVAAAEAELAAQEAQLAKKNTLSHLLPDASGFAKSASGSI